MEAGRNAFIWSLFIFIIGFLLGWSFGDIESSHTSPLITGINIESVKSTLEILSMLLQYTAWPLTIITLAILFKTPIQTVIHTLSKGHFKIGKEGVEFRPEQLNHDEKEHTKSFAEINNILKNQPLLDHYYNEDKNDFYKAAESEKILPEEYFLVRAIEFQLAWRFENLYRLIFGSQIKALQKLVASGNKCDISDLRLIYEEAIIDFPSLASNLDFEEWLAFLTKSGLVNINSRTAIITMEGSGLLNFIAHHNYSFKKIF